MPGEDQFDKRASDIIWELTCCPKRRIFSKSDTEQENVVAVWKSRDGYGHFELVGDGLTGELGSFFAFLALATALILEYETHTSEVKRGLSNCGGYELGNGNTQGGCVRECYGQCGYDVCDGSCGDG